MSARLDVTREQIVSFRRQANGLETRLPMDPGALRRAAWAGLQDSMPRAALLSIHARVDRTKPDTWEHPALVQVWGPRFSAYVVAEEDVPFFTLSRLPDEPRARKRATDTADRMQAFFGDRRLNYELAGTQMGVNPNSLRYAAPTGRVLIRWEGARRPLAWMVARPQIDPFEARLEAARRFLHVFGPSLSAGFADWLGIGAGEAERAFDRLAPELTPVATPVGERLLLAADEPRLRAPAEPATSVRLLPSGDSHWLYWGADRELLVPDARHRAELWTPRVWPGALLIGPEVVGTWRRAQEKVQVSLWRPLTGRETERVEFEALSLPLPDLKRAVSVSWDVLE